MKHVFAFHICEASELKSVQSFTITSPRNSLISWSNQMNFKQEISHKTNCSERPGYVSDFSSLVTQGGV